MLRSSKPRPFFFVFMLCAAGMLCTRTALADNFIARITASPASLKLSGGGTGTSALTADVYDTTNNQEADNVTSQTWTWTIGTVTYTATMGGTNSTPANPIGVNWDPPSPPYLPPSGPTATVKVTTNSAANPPETTGGYYTIPVHAHVAFTDSALGSGTADGDATIQVTVLQVDITGASANVVVGEQVNYGVSVAPSDLVQPPNLGPAYQWTIPGTTEDRVYSDFKNGIVYNGNDPETGHPVDFPQGYLQNASLSFYWVSGGSKTIKCTVTIASTVCSAQAQQNVLTPTASITVKHLGTIQLLPGNNGSVSVSDGTYAVPGIDLGASISPPSGFGTGGYQWAQILKESVTYNESNGHTWLLAGTGIDSIYPANPNQDRTDNPNYGVYPATLYEGPGKGFVTLTDVKTVTVADAFTVYLMYEPADASGNPLPNSIYVPVAFESWSFPATVQQVSGQVGQYNLVSPANGQQPNPTPTRPQSIWPVFTTNVLQDYAVETQ